MERSGWVPLLRDIRPGIFTSCCTGGACVWKPSLLRWACGSNIRRRLSTRYSTTASRGESVYLPAASYSLVSQEGGRGVYSFCMCPGGFIVPAMTDAAESVVNGISPSGRNSVFANSGLVTEVRLADFEHLRAEWGAASGAEIGSSSSGWPGNTAASIRSSAQRVADFVAGRASIRRPTSAYRALCLPGWISGCPDLSPLPCGRVSPLSGGGCDSF